MTAAYDPLFEALAHEVRRDIITILKLEKELCASDIHAKFIASRTSISYHLGILYDLGVLKTRKKGRNIYYYVDNDFIHKHLSVFIDTFVLAKG